MPEIGETLRDARMRARIDVSEIEAKTKIRAKYLRALENEEWGLLPGPTFVKSFLRTYVSVVGVIAVLIVLLVIGLLSGGGGGSHHPTAKKSTRPGTRHGTRSA